jgi:CDK-activating kinase assembly factor MAT1
MIMNLVLKTDVKKTEAALNKYKEANADVIKANNARERTQAAALHNLQAYEREQAHLRRQAAQQEYEDGRLGRDEKENLTLISLATGQLNASSLAARGRNAKAAADEVSDGERSVSDPSGLVKGLRRIRAPPPEKIYDPFMGMVTTRDYYTLREDYPSIRLTKAKSDTRTKAGGFAFDAFFDESLLQAFAGLGCFIDEEQAGRTQTVSRELATVVAAESSADMMSDDIL